MGALIAKIDRRRRVAEFSGDTFLHRDGIKALGTAVWEPGRKIWKIANFDLSSEALSQQFPGVIIDEIAAGADTATVEMPLLSSKKAPELVAKTAPASLSPGLPPNISVAELMQRAEAAVQRAFSETIFVRGVIASVKFSSDNRVFLSLAEENSPEQTLSCVIWSQDVAKVLTPLKAQGVTLEANLAIMFGGQVRFNRRRGEISLAITSVVPEYTMAKLLAQREKTNERLKKEGLFDRNRQCRLPLLPRRLGLVTSSGGTVIHDFRTSLDTARFGFELIWCHAAVQGESAVKEIVAAIASLEKRGVEAILIFRGGGSAADLAAFNDYAVARAVCLCAVPVFSAIGHQEDQSSVQDVSFHTEGVPQGLGRYFAQRVLQFRIDIEQRARRIVQRSSAVSELWLERIHSQLKTTVLESRRLLGSYEKELSRLNDRLLRGAAQRCDEGRRKTAQLSRLFSVVADGLLRHYSRTLQQYPMLLSQHIQRALRYREEKLGAVNAVVVASSPDVQLKRGFALIRSREDHVYITRGAGIAPGVELEIVFQDTATRVKALE